MKKGLPNKVTSSSDDLQQQVDDVIDREAATALILLTTDQSPYPQQQTNSTSRMIDYSLFIYSYLVANKMAVDAGLKSGN